MGRIGCACEVCPVTPIAGGRQRGVVIVGVTLRALNRNVRACKWKLRCAVIEG